LIVYGFLGPGFFWSGEPSTGKESKMGKILLELRTAILTKYVRQIDFAQDVGFHNSKVSMVLHGREKLSAEQAEQWRELLKCDRKILEPAIKSAGPN
jgi:hypothetical protein